MIYWTRACAWCGKVLPGLVEAPEGTTEEGTTHGICDKCHAEMMEQLNGKEVIV